MYVLKDESDLFHTGRETRLYHSGINSSMSMNNFTTNLNDAKIFLMEDQALHFLNSLDFKHTFSVFEIILKKVKTK